MTRLFADYPWRVVVTTMNSGVITYFDNRATDRQFLFTLNGPAYHTGQVASDDTEVNRPYTAVGDPAYLTNNRRLIYALRRELHASPPYVCRFGGIVMPLEDQGADATTTRYTAYDPWQLMYSRPARNPDTGALIREAGIKYAAEDAPRASEIALDMLATSEAQDGESHIDYTTDPSLIEATPVLDVAFTIDQAQSVGEVWDNLVATGTIDIELRPFYDPNRPGKVCELRIKRLMGQTRFNTVIGWDIANHSALEMNRTIDRLANKVRFMSGAASKATTQEDAQSVIDNGAYWVQQVLGGGEHQAKADLLALAEMLIRRNGERVLTFNPIADRNGYNPLVDYRLGDFLPVWASQNLREPIGVDYAAALIAPNFPGAAGYQRVYGIPLTIDDNGVQTVEGLIASQDTQL